MLECSVPLMADLGRDSVDDKHDAEDEDEEEEEENGGQMSFILGDGCCTVARNTYAQHTHTHTYASCHSLQGTHSSCSILFTRSLSFSV